MLIRPVSDIHTELVGSDSYKDHFEYLFPKLPQDSETVLVLAGDLFSLSIPSTYKAVIEAVKDRFKAVIIIFGNHEWYGGHIPHSSKNFLKYIEPFKNIHFLNGDNVFIDDVEFIGATLWTDFDKGNVGAAHASQSFMNDYAYIKISDGIDIYITPQDLSNFHEADLNAITYLLSVDNGYKKVVVTHHGASMQCIHPRYANGGLVNYSFTSDLEDIIIKYQPKLWLSGHTHESLDFMVDETRYIINPCGYRSRYVQCYENPEFDSQLVIEV